MNILVCLKQVPDTAKVKFNRETNTLDRTGVENIMNPYDRQALEVALCLKDKEGAKVTVLTMGLPQATDILKEAIAMGADDGVLLSDRVLGGSDTLATSLALAAAVKHLGEFDLVLCGKQAVDGDTAQVGPEMAEHLGIPQITGALSLNYADGKFVVVRENENYQMTLACAAPLLVTVTKSEKEPRFASIKGKMKARKAQIPTLTVADLDIDPATVGLKGSPTKVKKAFTPTPPEINGEIITEEDADAAVDMLFEKLVKAEVITR
ncbi:electron transfer flavoprotein subunit beta/FixA family protein [Phascolarctobacterium succinatutens]|uniref:electron transfer flavoprotein subunit beta/FixA family protein n=1 Tax=Phascolarctobacterium succinatutens TaxID=626940 RepID=UPI0026F19535|nr:electron transfer flavoprotein subunit beta/FixA family protein [Phascolarctobacterium succinatutens]